MLRLPPLTRPRRPSPSGSDPSRPAVSPAYIGDSVIRPFQAKIPVPADSRASRRAVGAAMFDPNIFMGLYEQCAEQRAKYWAGVRKDPAADAR